MKPITRTTTGSSLTGRFTYGSTAGSITLDEPAHHWTLEFALPATVADLQYEQRSTGFKIASVDSTQVLVLQPADGVLLGQMPLQVTPELFSADLSIREEHSCSFVQIGQQAVALRQQVSGELRSFALVVGPGEVETLSLALDQWLGAQEPTNLWEQESGRRAAWTPPQSSKALASQTCQAMELLDSLLVSDGANHAVQLLSEIHARNLDVNEVLLSLPPLVATQPEHGLAIATALFERLGSDAVSLGAWPIFHLVLERMLEQGPPFGDREREALLEGANHALSSWLDRATGMEEVLPVWPEPDDALTPEIVDASGRPADLPLLILADLDARERLGASLASFASPRDTLEADILATFRQSSNGLIMDLGAGGAPAKRLTPSSLLPLLVPRFKESLHPAIDKELRGAAHLLTEEGILQWEAWESDEDSPPVRAVLQLLLAPAVLAQSPSDVRTLVGGSWVRGLRRLDREALGLSGEWGSASASSDPWNCACAGLCLTVTPIRSQLDLSLGDYSPTVRFLERHRRSVVGGITGVLLSAVIALSIYYAVLPSLTHRQQYTMIGVADSMYQMKQYEKARTHYLEVIERIRDERFLPVVYFKLGKTEYHLQDYDRALEYFEKAVALEEARFQKKKTPQSLAPLWNLAQLQRLSGDEAAALGSFERVIELFGDRSPGIESKAKRAINLIQSPSKTLSESIKTNEP